MTQIADLLANGIEESGRLLTRFLAGFDDSNATRQAPGFPNHVNWTLGHLALYMHRAAELIGSEASDLGWNPEPFAFGSAPDAAAEPSHDEMGRRFQTSLARLAAAIRRSDDASLAAEIPWGGGTVKASDLAIRMIFHNGTHCGQIVDLRRALNLGSAIK